MSINKTKPVIQVKNLRKSYGELEVLKGINLDISTGTMLALLGPNGAGKTTTVKILSTLLQYDSGTVSVHGYDVKTESDKVRSVIGLTGQSAAVDELLTGRENLVMMGRLYRLTAKSANQRADELLEQFDLVAAAGRPTKTYSGGMRRRLDLAVSLIATPPIIFLDEPTTGLDPRSRIAMWQVISDLKKQGATILLTTQYLEEADQLADEIAVIDNGIVIARGTSTELKSKVGKDRLILSFGNLKSYTNAMKELNNFIAISDSKELSHTLLVNDVNKDLKMYLDILSKNKIELKSVDIHKPTLDDVFLSLTGKVNKEQSKEEA
jgi:ABC-2 type transport system ATP-binding protein